MSGYLQSQRQRPLIVVVAGPHRPLPDRTETAGFQDNGSRANQAEINKDTIDAVQRAY